MTKRDYLFLAAVMRAAVKNAATADQDTQRHGPGALYAPGAELAARTLASCLKAANPRFEELRFLADVGIAPTPEAGRVDSMHVWNGAPK